jgi:hypothetical protein
MTNGAILVHSGSPLVEWSPVVPDLVAACRATLRLMQSGGNVLGTVAEHCALEEQLAAAIKQAMPFDPQSLPTVSPGVLE